MFFFVGHARDDSSVGLVKRKGACVNYNPNSYGSPSPDINGAVLSDEGRMIF